MAKILKTNWKLLVAIAILAGFVYNSWPLGYVLNRPAASLLASDLEGRHQPYNWVFIGGDIASSVLVIGVAIYLLERYGGIQKWLRLPFIAMILFGIGTIVDAALPLRCVPTASLACPDFVHDPVLFAHGVCSILASCCLFVAIFCWWMRMPRNWFLRAVFAGYVLFALFSLIDVLINSKSALSQHYYISLCGIGIAMFPWAVWRGLKQATLPIKN